MKLSNKQYVFDKQCTKGELFKLDKDNNYTFRRGNFRGQSMHNLFKTYGDGLIDYLEELYDDANSIDKKVILEIIKRDLKIKTNINNPPPPKLSF